MSYNIDGGGLAMPTSACCGGQEMRRCEVSHAPQRRPVQVVMLVCSARACICSGPVNAPIRAEDGFAFRLQLSLLSGLLPRPPTSCRLWITLESCGNGFGSC